MADTPSVTGEPLPLLISERYEAAKAYVRVHDFAVLAGHTWHRGKCSCGRPDCDRPAKHPLTKNGVKDATKDLGTVASWWAQLRGLPNVAIATGAASGVAVVDFDVKSGGLETLALWKQEHGELPRTPTVRTPTGGLHLFFRHVQGVGSKTGVAPGVDCRGDGGQVVAPPSVHANGEKYQWVEPLTTPLAEMPGWLLDIVSKPKTQEKPRAGLPVVAPANPMVMTLSAGAPDLRTSAGAGEGKRHDSLCRLAGAQLARGDREVRVLEDALAWAETCEPPMEIGQVVRTVQSLAAKHSGSTAITVVPTIRAKVADDVDDVKMPDPPPWPVLHEDASHGIVGDYLKAIGDSTEADPVGILVSKLVAFGNCVGRGPRFLIEGDFHHANEFVVTVGQSAKGRKGTALGRSTALLRAADPDWHTNQIASGMSSGEGVIWSVRDPIERAVPVKEKGTVKGYQSVVEDPGVTDKRLLVVETEFAQALRAMRREGNTLSAIIRQAWDRGVLRAMTKNSPARATDAHVSILGHISAPELEKCLGDVELFSGFANRFLWTLVRRHQLLPEGGEAVQLDAMAARMSGVLTAAKAVTAMSRSPEARAMWRDVYPALTADRPGLYGAATGRAEAHVLRVSMIYALLDGQGVIGTDHLKAALALWAYCDESAKIIFGHAHAEVGDALEKQLLTLIRQTQGINRRGLHQALGGHVNGTVLVSALAKLRDRSQVRCEKVSTGGRPGECWFPCGAVTTA